MKLSLWSLRSLSLSRKFFTMTRKFNSEKCIFRMQRREDTEVNFGTRKTRKTRKLTFVSSSTKGCMCIFEREFEEGITPTQRIAKGAPSLCVRVLLKYLD